MTIETLVQDELTDNERNALAAFTAFSEQVAAGAHLDQWLSHIPALSRGRALCMRATHSNAPTGRRYAQMFSEWRDLYIRKLAKEEITALLWFSDDPSRQTKLAELRGTMTSGQRQRLTLPTSARKLVERTMRPKTGDEDGSDKEPTWKERAAALQNHVHALEAKLTKAEQDGGSLFDLHGDKADGIGRVIADSVSPYKAKAIAKAITDRIAERAAKHAG